MKNEEAKVGAEGGEDFTRYGRQIIFNHAHRSWGVTRIKKGLSISKKES